MCEKNKNTIGLRYLGQEGFLFQYKDTCILIDGYLSDYVDRHCCRPGVFWERRYAPPVFPESLTYVDYVFCTHSHFDHADPDTLSSIIKVNGKAKFIVPAIMEKEALSYGIPEERLLLAHADEMLSFADFSVLPIPAAHETLETDAEGNYTALGYRFSFEDISLFHAGDCCIYEGLEKRLLGTDILLLPINGRSWFKLYEQDIIGNMTAEEAVVLAARISPSLLIPMHFDLYDINCYSPAHFTELAHKANIPFHIFTPGEYYCFQK